MIRVLPVYKGYTVDARLKEFRLVSDTAFEIIDFDGETGDAMLVDYISTLAVGSREFDEIANAIL